jgi:hypothetical protein
VTALALCLPWPGDSAAGETAPSYRFPWKAAGLTEREAAAHLLGRFSYGPRPGEIDRVLKMGLERWFERQLAGRQPEPRLWRLDALPALSMSADEIARTYRPRTGDRSPRELVGQLQTQKLWRAAEAENQLTEVMTDFWFNHFNVSLTDNQARGYVLSYERDAIRPDSLGDFRDLLGATARHPAMRSTPARRRPASRTAARPGSTPGRSSSG